MELVDSIHAQNAPPHRAEMGDESAKSKGKPPNCTTFVVQFVPGLLTTLLSSGNIPGLWPMEPRPKFRIRGGGGGDFLREFKDKFGPRAHGMP